MKKGRSMFRARVVGAAIAVAMGLISGEALALGLGDATLNSALYQPLDAEIQLQDLQELQASDLRIGLASAEDFAKSGVDRPVFLNDLMFTLVMRPNNRSVLHVTSRQPVREPYLDFIVQVVTAKGRLAHEYTLLLDPAPAGRPATAAMMPQLPVTQAPTQALSSASAARTPTISTAARASGRYTTRANDSLFNIAARYRAGGSVAQNMLAIQKLNPNAFVNGNINGLRRNQELQLPDAHQAADRSRRDAEQRVLAQNDAWKQQRGLATAAAAPLDATPQQATASAAPSEIQGHDNLSVVAPPAKHPKGTKGDAQAVRDQLAVAQEGLDTARRESDELHGRIADLQSQLDKLQRLVELKNNELARMQAAMVKPDTAATCAAAMPAAPAPQGTASTPLSAGCNATLATNTPTPAVGGVTPPAASQAPVVVH